MVIFKLTQLDKLSYTIQGKLDSNPHMPEINNYLQPLGQCLDKSCTVQLPKYCDRYCVTLFIPVVNGQIVMSEIVYVMLDPM